MTLQEAKKQLQTSENEIKSSYNNLKSDAEKVGLSAVSAASSTTTKRTVLPLAIVLIGLLMCAFSPFLGIVCIAGGIYLSYKAHQAASSTEKRITDLKNNLTFQINSNSNI